MCSKKNNVLKINAKVEKIGEILRGPFLGIKKCLSGGLRHHENEFYNSLTKTYNYTVPTTVPKHE
jgi:hypothetical protein